MRCGKSPVALSRLRFRAIQADTKSSGAGATLWQVVVGRAIAGLGGAGMTCLVSILIAGTTEFCLWSLLAQVLMRRRQSPTS